MDPPENHSSRGGRAFATLDTGSSCEHTLNHIVDSRIRHLRAQIMMIGQTEFREWDVPTVQRSNPLIHVVDLTKFYYLELLRRIKREKLSPKDRQNSIQYKWDIRRFNDWLLSHPITNKEDILYLRREVSKWNYHPPSTAVRRPHADPPGKDATQEGTKESATITREQVPRNEGQGSVSSANLKTGAPARLWSCQDCLSRCSQPIARRKILHAMVIGVSDIINDPKVQLVSQMTVDKVVYIQEVVRRINRSNNVLLRAVTNQYVHKWNIEDLKRWLEDHPIIDKSDIAFLRHKIGQLSQSPPNNSNNFVHICPSTLGVAPPPDAQRAWEQSKRTADIEINNGRFMATSQAGKDFFQFLRLLVPLYSRSDLAERGHIAKRVFAWATCHGGRFVFMRSKNQCAQCPKTVDLLNAIHAEFYYLLRRRKSEDTGEREREPLEIDTLPTLDVLCDDSKGQLALIEHEGPDLVSGNAKLRALFAEANRAGSFDVLDIVDRVKRDGGRFMKVTRPNKGIDLNLSLISDLLNREMGSRTTATESKNNQEDVNESEMPPAKKARWSGASELSSLGDKQKNARRLLRKRAPRPLSTTSPRKLPRRSVRKPIYRENNDESISNGDSKKDFECGDKQIDSGIAPSKSRSLIVENEWISHNNISSRVSKDVPGVGRSSNGNTDKNREQCPESQEVPIRSNPKSQKVSINGGIDQNQTRELTTSPTAEVDSTQTDIEDSGEEQEPIAADLHKLTTGLDEKEKIATLTKITRDALRRAHVSETKVEGLCKTIDFLLLLTSVLFLCATFFFFTTIVGVA